MDHREPADVWARRHFEHADMTDVRRTERVIAIAQAMAMTPEASVPRLFARAYEVKAAYTLFRHPEATPDALQFGHRQLTLDLMSEPGIYLLIEDTTSASWSGKQPIQGLGQIGNGADGLQGLKIHTVLGVRWRGSEKLSEQARRPGVEVIGICHQEYWARARRPKGTPREHPQQRKRRERESQRWDRASRTVGPAPAGARWIEVADCEADIYEKLSECLRQGHGFVIRAAKDRALQDEESHKRTGQLMERVRALARRGQIELELRARPGQPARTAQLQVGWTRVQLSSPWRPGYAPGQMPAIPSTVVRIWEPAPPPATAEPLEWILLCDAEIENFEQALECILQYVTRWLVEDFHKALKTGLKAEQLQLEQGHALRAALAIKSVVALRLLALREQLRIAPEAQAAEAGLGDLELQVLRAVTRREVTNVREVALAIGRLGGHLNRKGDGMPGWQTLWHGMHRLLTLVEGVHLGRKLHEFG
jgi:Transposase DNA-binding/Transposase Tn5 dimerisation domain